MPVLKEWTGGNGRGGPSELFWTSFGPFTVLAGFATALLVAVLCSVVLRTGPAAAGLAASAALVVHLVVLLPVQYYLVRARVLRPIARLEREVRGDLPWEPDGDELLRPLRRAMEDLRGAALDAVSDAQRQREKLEELQVRLDDGRSGQTLCDRLFEVLRTPGSVAQYGAIVADLLRAAWPAEHVLLLSRRAPSTEFHVVYAEHDGNAVSETAVLDPGYSRASMPRPVKDALRRGFTVETGVPFMRDPGLPGARSFVAMALEHGGSVAGVLFLATSCATPPSAEALRRARPLLSLAFSRSQLLDEAEEIAIRDALTGAYTPDHFFALLRNEVARSNRYSRPLACLVVDVDRLREINERYGARFGDQVIAQVAQLAQGAIRSTDVLGRVSGGEMALLLPETDEASARVVAERMRERVHAHPFVLRSTLVDPVSVSVGIALHPPAGVTALGLVDAARAAVRTAKACGRDCVAVAADPDI